jgi:hypothetical protein
MGEKQAGCAKGCPRRVSLPYSPVSMIAVEKLIRQAGCVDQEGTEFKPISRPWQGFVQQA